LGLRGIEYEPPKRIYERAQERYFDRETGHLIAVMNVELYDKNREVMVAYISGVNRVKLLTIHPLKKRQKENRVHTGR